MRRGAAHLTVVFGDSATARQLRCALERHGVDHAAVGAHVNSIRRSLVPGENKSVVVCIALDKDTMDRHGPALKRLLSDHQCFPTTVRTVGLLSDLGLTREAAELGCDVYVENTAQAAQAIQLLDGSTEDKDLTAPAGPRRWHIQGGWMYGSPALPDELTSLIPADSGRAGYGIGDTDSFSPRRIDRSGVDFGDPSGPP